jgi:2-oxo-3-hexenedioate decarboxylase/2-keto-4-pentenoate hydratase
MAETGVAGLVAARLSGTPLVGLGADAPHDMPAAYRLQSRANEVLSRTLGPVAGWKIGCTTPVMQAYLGIDRPCAGAVFATTLHASPAEIERRRFVRPGVECEIAVRLGGDLGPADAPFTRERVGAAVAAVMASIELVDDRYVDWRGLGAPTLTADNFFGAGCVLGPEVRDWWRHDLGAVSGRMAIDGRIVGEGRGDAILGHPLDALVWLAETASTQGWTLRAGTIVTLGSLVQTQWLDRDQDVVVTLDGFGEARLRVV